MDPCLSVALSGLWETTGLAGLCGHRPGLSKSALFSINLFSISSLPSLKVQLRDSVISGEVSLPDSSNTLHHTLGNITDGPL